MTKPVKQVNSAHQNRGQWGGGAGRAWRDLVHQQVDVVAHEVLHLVGVELGLCQLLPQGPGQLARRREGGGPKVSQREGGALGGVLPADLKPGRSPWGTETHSNGNKCPGKTLGKIHLPGKEFFGECGPEGKIPPR